MTASSSKRELRRALFTRRYLVQAPKIVLAMRNWMSAEGDEAVDAIQDVFIRLIERIDASDVTLDFEEFSDEKLRNYIAQAIRNRWIDIWRRLQIIKRNYEELISALEHHPTPEELMIESERQAHLRRSVASLRSPYRDILQAVLEDDVTLAEIARRRKIKIGTIYTQFGRALEELRAEWNRQAAEVSRHEPPRLGGK
jgi:RNA polymerase sigma factor (sigma-70 family)